MQQVGMDSATPPELGDNAFDNTNDTFVIAVPGAGYWEYQSQDRPNWYAQSDHFIAYQANNEIWYHLVGNEGSHYGWHFGGDHEPEMQRDCGGDPGKDRTAGRTVSGNKLLTEKGLWGIFVIFVVIDLYPYRFISMIYSSVPSSSFLSPVFTNPCFE